VHVCGTSACESEVRDSVGGHVEDVRWKYGPPRGWDWWTW